MQRQKNKVLFIDRDGVLHEDLGTYVTRWEDLKLIPGVLESLAKVTAAGFQTVLVSNQAGIGDGVYKESVLQEITSKLKEAILSAGGRVDAVYYCLHGKNAGCGCRKPKTGLFERAAQDFSFEKASTFFIGDKDSDIIAGKDFGLRTILVLTGYGKTDREKLSPQYQPDFIVEDFSAAVEKVLQASAGGKVS